MPSYLRPDLLISEVDDELIVLDPVTLEAHHLNPVAAGIFKDLRLGKYPSRSPKAENVLRLFADIHFLLESEPATAQSSPGLTRRHFLSNSAVAVAAGAILTTLSLPTPASAASGTTEIFTTAGSSSSTVPAGATLATITVVGGGGGKGGNGVSGAAYRAPGALGQTTTLSFTVTPGQVLTVVVGDLGKNGQDAIGSLVPGSGGSGGSGNPRGADGQRGGSTQTFKGGGGGGAGGTSSVNGTGVSISALGGTGGGGTGGFTTNRGQPGTLGGAGAAETSSSSSAGGNGGTGATGTGDADPATAGSVTIVYT